MPEKRKTIWSELESNPGPLASQATALTMPSRAIKPHIGTPLWGIKEPKVIQPTCQLRPSGFLTRCCCSDFLMRVQSSMMSGSRSMYTMNGPAMVTGFFRRSESNESSFFRREAFKELKQRRINLECLFFSGRL